MDFNLDEIFSGIKDAVTTEAKSYDYSEFKKLGEDFLNEAKSKGPEAAKKIAEHMTKIGKLIVDVKTGKIDEYGATTAINNHKNSIKVYTEGLQEGFNWETAEKWHQLAETAIKWIKVIASVAIKAVPIPGL